MQIELAGFYFSNEPTSKHGNIFMSFVGTGEGTEIAESKIQDVLTKLFNETM